MAKRPCGKLFRDADGVRTSEVEHAVQDPDHDINLGALPIRGAETGSVSLRASLFDGAGLM